jgi:hypothetical protein
MNKISAPQLVIVGSIGIDTIETPREKRVEILGGSVSYACAAASFFVKTGMVGVVGTDFPPEHRALWEKMGIDLAGLQTEKGKTFRWAGIYEEITAVRFLPNSMFSKAFRRNFLKPIATRLIFFWATLRPDFSSMFWSRFIRRSLC